MSFPGEPYQLARKVGLPQSAAIKTPQALSLHPWISMSTGSLSTAYHDTPLNSAAKSTSKTTRSSQSMPNQLDGKPLSSAKSIQPHQWTPTHRSNNPSCPSIPNSAPIPQHPSRKHIKKTQSCTERGGPGPAIKQKTVATCNYLSSNHV